MSSFINRSKEKIAKDCARLFSIGIMNREKRNQKRKEFRQKLRKLLDVQGPEKTAYGDRYIYTGEEGSDVILKLLRKNRPCLVARFGSVELSAVNHFISSKRYLIEYPSEIKKQMSENAGFFPAENQSISRFSSEMLDIVRNVDVMGCWFNKGEETVCQKYCPDAKLVKLESINSVTYSEPWTQYLKGKKVLVIHPFAETIQQQYKKHQLLYENPKVLPEFELVTLKAVQSIADNKDFLEYENWFDALDNMCRKIDQIDFDIALIGAGAYGIFLGYYCKKIGRQAVHMGGVTQILFGITGKRFEEDNYGLKVNEHWTRPSSEDRPKGFEKVEGGCYW